MVKNGYSTEGVDVVNFKASLSPTPREPFVFGPKANASFPFRWAVLSGYPELVETPWGQGQDQKDKILDIKNLSDPLPNGRDCSSLPPLAKRGCPTLVR